MRRRSQSAITPVTIRITVKSKPSLTIIDRALSALRSTWSFAARNPIAGCSRNSTTRIIAAANMRNRQPYRSPSRPTNSPFILLMQRRLQAHQFAYVHVVFENAEIDAGWSGEIRCAFEVIELGEK